MDQRLILEMVARGIWYTLVTTQEIDTIPGNKVRNPLKKSNFGCFPNSFVLTFYLTSESWFIVPFSFHHFLCSSMFYCLLKNINGVNKMNILFILKLNIIEKVEAMITSLISKLQWHNSCLKSNKTLTNLFSL